MAEIREQGVAVRSARVARRMTQAHLATAADVSEKTVRRAEAGERLGPESLRSICSVLDLDATLLGTEAECVPAAAAEAARLAVARKRRGAFLVSVLTSSLALTLAWSVLSATEMVSLAIFSAYWTGICFIANVASGYATWNGTVVPATNARQRYLGALSELRSPIRLARRASGGDMFLALRVACLPPAVLVTLNALKLLMAEPGYLLAMATMILLLVTWGIMQSTVLDASGLREDVAAGRV